MWWATQRCLHPVSLPTTPCCEITTLQGGMLAQRRWLGAVVAPVWRGSVPPVTTTGVTGDLRALHRAPHSVPLGWPLRGLAGSAQGAADRAGGRAAWEGEREERKREHQRARARVVTAVVRAKTPQQAEAVLNEELMQSKAPLFSKQLGPLLTQVCARAALKPNPVEAVRVADGNAGGNAGRRAKLGEMAAQGMCRVDWVMDWAKQQRGLLQVIHPWRLSVPRSEVIRMLAGETASKLTWLILYLTQRFFSSSSSTPSLHRCVGLGGERLPADCMMCSGAGRWCTTTFLWPSTRSGVTGRGRGGCGSRCTRWG